MLLSQTLSEGMRNLRFQCSLIRSVGKVDYRAVLEQKYGHQDRLGH